METRSRLEFWGGEEEDRTEMGISKDKLLIQSSKAHGKMRQEILEISWNVLAVTVSFNKYVQDTEGHVSQVC